MGDNFEVNNNLKTTLGQLFQKNLNIDTGNGILNTLLITLVMMVFNNYFIKILNNFEELKMNFRDFIKRLFSFYEPNQITLEGTISKNRYGDNMNLCSDEFITCVNWVLQEIPHIPNLKKLKEEEMRETKIDNNQFDTKKNLILDHLEPLCLDKKNDIWIKFDVNITENDIKKDNKAPSASKSIKIFLSSKRTSVHQIKKILDERTKKFIEKLELETMNKTYFFEFIKNNLDECFTEFSQIQFNTNRKISNVFFDQKQEFLEKFNFFRNNREWYERLGIPYHLGILLYGLPGCGKTSLIKAIANETGYQIISIPLSRVKTSKDLSNIFHAEKINRHKVPMSKRIYLFEDIDAMDVALKREKKSDDTSYSSNESEKEEDKEFKEIPKKDETNMLAKLIKEESLKISSTLKDDDQLTLSHLLNLIDGLIEMPGRIIIFTTNHKSKLDPALIRPGRVDIAIEMKKASKKVIGEMYEWFYEKKMTEEDIERMPQERFTPAEVSNIFYKFNTSPEEAVKYFKNFV